MKDGKIAIVEEEAELVRLIFRRYLELGSVNELLRDLRERNIRTKTKRLATGATRGGIPFGRGALYVLSNHFYIGEVKYKNEILPGEQPPIMDRALFESVRQKSIAQWSHRTIVRNKSDHLLTGLLFDDAGHRMIPTHATKAGVRYRYYVSTPFLHGDAKTASAGSVPRVPAADIEDTVVKCLREHLAARQDKSTTSAVRLADRDDLAQLVAGVVVHRDRLIVRFKSDHADEGSDFPDGSLTIPWRKPPSKRSRQILLPHNASRSGVRPEQFERRARLVSAIARGRRWLDDVVSGRVTTRSGVSPVAAAAYAGNDAIVEALLAHGADERASDETGKPPIVYAAAGARLDIVKRLLARNIDINARYPNDLTLLMWASGPCGLDPDQIALRRRWIFRRVHRSPRSAEVTGRYPRPKA
jgi:hypothetical protein